MLFVYHGSIEKVDSLLPKTDYRKAWDDYNNAIPILFLTSNKNAAYKFTNDKWLNFSLLQKRKHPYLYIYTCHFISKLNFFDSSDNTDLTLLYEIISNKPNFLSQFNKGHSWHGTFETIDSLLQKMKITKSFWELENSAIQTILKNELRFDGFITHEKNTENYGIYDNNKIIIDKIERKDP
jgi:hypothetical protein